MQQLHNTELYNKIIRAIETEDLITLQCLRDEDPAFFKQNTYNLIHIIILYDKTLSIIEWIMSIDDNMSADNIYSEFLYHSCLKCNSHIINYLLSLRIIKNSTLNSHAFSYAFTAVKYKYDWHVQLINNLYSMLPNIDLTANNNHYLFHWAVSNFIRDNESKHLVEWLIDKKPYHYNKIVNVEEKTVCYRIVDYKEQRWNSLKTILFMSQIKPEKPHKSSIFRFISDDVVKIICEYV